MPIYDYRCGTCGANTELMRPVNATVECCGIAMEKLPSSPSMIRIKGEGYPSRRRWMDNWTPNAKTFQTNSVHGAKC